VVPVPLATVAVFPASPHVTVDLFLTVHPQTTAFVHTRNRTEAPLLEFLWVQVSNSQMNEGSEAQKTIYSIMTFLGAQVVQVLPRDFVYSVF
jgi:hypothetical protein